MPTPNYSFEKRQRELAKKKKQEEKDARRREARAAAHASDASPDESPGAEDIAAADANPEAATAAPRVHLRKPADK